MQISSSGSGTRERMQLTVGVRTKSSYSSFTTHNVAKAREAVHQVFGLDGRRQSRDVQSLGDGLRRQWCTFLLYRSHPLRMREVGSSRYLGGDRVDLALSCAAKSSAEIRIAVGSLSRIVLGVQQRVTELVQTR